MLSTEEKRLTARYGELADRLDTLQERLDEESSRLGSLPPWADDSRAISLEEAIADVQEKMAKIHGRLGWDCIVCFGPQPVGSPGDTCDHCRQL